MTPREIQDALAARAVGQFPVSIATSLALEGAFGIYPERPVVNPPPIKQYQEVWINVRTLMRNLLGSLPQDVQDKFMPGWFLLAIPQELSFIESEILRRTEGMVRTVCYYADHSDLKRVLPGALPKVSNTPKQKFQETLEREGLRQLIEEMPLRKTRTTIEGRQRKALMITHHPVDLLSRYEFRQLDLLESHTGIIKDPSQWNTKLTGGRDLPPLPFINFTVSLFGDNNQLLQAQPLKLRRTILEIAERDRWSAITTLDKIRLGIKSIEDPALRASAQVLLS